MKAQEGGFTNPFSGLVDKAKALKNSAGAAYDKAKDRVAGVRTQMDEKVQQASMLAKVASWGSQIPTAMAAAGVWMRAGLVGETVDQIPASFGQKLIMRGIPALVILAVIAYFIYKKFVDKKLLQSASTDKIKPVAKEGFQVVPATEEVDSNDLTLLNTQQLAIKQAGFLGPITGGAFASEEATGKALKAGFRTLVLQIDYLETQKGKDWADAGVPTLVWKDDTGAITSTNSGSIEAVARTIATMAFSGATPNATKPVVLYLHVLRAPSATKNAGEYLRYLSRIAKALAPLAPFHLGLTPAGSFHRQAQEKELLMMPLSAMENKVIILSNADTSLFRSVGKLNLADKFNPDEDLDFWVNMRVYLESDGGSFGITQAGDPSATNAVITSLGKVANLNETTAAAFATKGKQRFTIALPTWDENPTFEQLNWALNTAGVNMIPLEIFDEANKADLEKLGRLYGNRAYRPKPVGMRNMTA